jgi:hypothetical protein
MILSCMKSITVYFENEEFEKLSKSKNKMTWHNYIMKLVKEDKNDEFKEEL